ncbi:MAG TPA: globin [Cytophagaceae bacterium]|nr:globin [Cytophagaceae bacterium]
MEEKTLYEKLGPENLRKLVDKFYDLVFEDPEIKDLFRTDKELIKRKQFMFLSQFLGGPALYSDEYGHPQMRARHLPHPITEDKAVAWLKCMHTAIDTLEISDEMKKGLFERFPPTAFFMVNS